jgi:hypothetical protein
MKQIIFSLAMLLTTSLAHARELTVTVNGAQVRLQTTTLNRELTAKDKQAGDRQSAVGCSLLFHGLLATGDIDQASRLTSDPAKAGEMWTSYRERLGDAEFKKMMEEYFTTKTVIQAELVHGNTHMLIVQPPNDPAGAQMYRQENGGFVRLEGMASDEAKTLGKVFGMIRSGTVKLQ